MYSKRHRPTSVKIIQGILSIAVVFMLAISATRNIKATFKPAKTVAQVLIDEKNFGVFQEITNLDAIIAENPNFEESGGYKTVTMTRDFVTDPSLYHWAQKNFNNPNKIKDIDIIIQTLDGDILSRYTLNKSKPLVWTVEAADPAIGGFRERVEVAVQKVSIH